MSKLIKLSSAQVRALRDVRAGDPVKSCRGRSEYGGRGQVIQSLRRRGLVAFLSNGRVTITTLGNEWLTSHDVEALEKALRPLAPLNDGGESVQ
jgi:hypothetical protein